MKVTPIGAGQEWPCAGDPWSGQPVNSCGAEATRCLVGELPVGLVLATCCDRHVLPLRSFMAAQLDGPGEIYCYGVEAHTTIERLMRETAGDVWTLASRTA